MSEIDLKQNLGILKKARKHLAENEWTQVTLARDERGWPVHPKSPNATCWCALGAIDHFLDYEYNLDDPDDNLIYSHNLYEYMNQIVRNTKPTFVSLWRYNDIPFREKEDVLAMFDVAIVELENEIGDTL